MEFKNLVKFRRSCRNFTPGAITDKQLNHILEAGRWAPSPLNLQPWEFILVTDAEVKAEIKSAGEAAKKDVADQDGPGWAQKYDMGFIEAAPLLIVVAYNPAKGGLGNYFDQVQGASQAASAAIQNMMLAAADIGLSSLWFTFIRPQLLHEILNIPSRLETAGIIVVGAAAEEAKAPPRKELRIHHETYTDSNA